MATPAVSNAVIAERVEALTAAVHGLTADVKLYTKETNERIHLLDKQESETAGKVIEIEKKVEAISSRTEKWWNLGNSIAIAATALLAYLKGNN